MNDDREALRSIIFLLLVKFWSWRTYEMYTIGKWWCNLHVDFVMHATLNCFFVVVLQAFEEEEFNMGEG